ncbi:MAG TPA: haloacid dehalogenase type II [Isosphaeraceae bacterium]|nr:haloacid dehalogenase type II [Isosphaeraceae bacterium]
MSDALAFDVYGTLLDLNALLKPVGAALGDPDQAHAFLSAWRRTQIEYAIRRAAMRTYEDFPTCSRQALDFTNRSLRAGLSEQDQQKLLDAQNHLPAYPDAAGGLESLKSAGLHLLAFSNGPRKVLEPLLDQAGLLSRFDGLVSADEVKTFKPAPEVYEHLVQSAQRPKAEVWLISSNPWDVLGARFAGLRTAWVRRSEDEVFDPWELEPELTVSSINELAPALCA